MTDILLGIPWAIMLIILPLITAMMVFVWPRTAQTLVLIYSLVMVIAVAGLGLQIWQQGVFQHSLGGWDAPLGIELYADGLSLVMLMATALVGAGCSIYASAYFNAEQAHRFWPIWLLLLAALNALFLSADLFNLYVTLELMGLAAVALTALSGSRNALAGAMRYLLSTLAGSIAYLLGVVLLYQTFGSVDIFILAERITPEPAAWAALVLMIVGLALKTALFPLHFWLPPAHASAPSPVSAVLSALVVKASFYILIRLWISLFGPISGDIVAVLLGIMGSVAILWGSVQALRQTRLKLLVAYSTVAQIGYLFLVFPLAAAAGAWHAAAILALSHALAKAAMFLAAGNLLHFGRHDRIKDLDRVVQRLPLSAFAFALAGVSIMGLPPSGGFIGKWLMLEAALVQGRWDLVAVMLIGGLLAALYIFKVLGRCFTEAEVTHEPSRVPARMEWAALLLALGAITLGFLAVPFLSLLQIGAPFSGSGS
ncbi:multicomponent Na+:H+ antiporter subunit D [Psychrobacter sp. PL15]|uniref:complex I subunit 5 family protein n=1 Tax=Psychrobacter sp. PL15 TaxID=3071719 RepID=UPI002DFF4F80|nr:multicomponent Na+:H+ antiporter subunit D [Psychrobacter sp. PL15]